MDKIIRISTIKKLTRLPKITSVTCRQYSATAKPPSSRKLSRNTSSSTTAAADGLPNNEPIAYFGSGAAKWTARQGQSGGRDEHLWYQPLVISGSLAVFLIYFCVLREENDIDNKLEGSLYDHVAGLEETQIQLSMNYNKEQGLSTEALEKRMAELQQLKEDKQ